MKKVISSSRVWLVLALTFALTACKGGGGGGGGNTPSNLTTWPFDAGDHVLALAETVRAVPVLNWLL